MKKNWNLLKLDGTTFFFIKAQSWIICLSLNAATPSNPPIVINPSFVPLNTSSLQARYFHF
jgi:hypothetical protein